jgi:hypothetical protein
VYAKIEMITIFNPDCNGILFLFGEKDIMKGRNYVG